MITFCIHAHNPQLHRVGPHQSFHLHLQWCLSPPNKTLLVPVRSFGWAVQSSRRRKREKGSNGPTHILPLPRKLLSSGCMESVRSRQLIWQIVFHSVPSGALCRGLRHAPRTERGIFIGTVLRCNWDDVCQKQLFEAKNSARQVCLEWNLPGSRLILHFYSLTLSKPHVRFENNLPLCFQVIRPQNGSAVLKY